MMISYDCTARAAQPEIFTSSLPSLFRLSAELNLSLVWINKSARISAHENPIDPSEVVNILSESVIGCSHPSAIIAIPVKPKITILNMSNALSLIASTNLYYQRALF